MNVSVGIVDTRRANLVSVRSAFDYLGAEAKICPEPDDLASNDRLVLPGVGAFADAIRDLEYRGMAQALNEYRDSGRPILGLCLGMQLMARASTEGDLHAGLGWIPGDVIRLDTADRRVPHIGWNEVTPTDGPLFRGIPIGADFYFLHSYHLVCDDDAVIDATCDYQGTLVAAVRLENVAGTQFHPEKSQDHGLRLLDNFLAWRP